MDWVYVLLGAAIAAPLSAAVTWLATRRIWRTARKLSARSKGRESLAELGRLAGGLAHEIKNPLSTINVNLKLLAEDLSRGDNEEHRRWLRRIGGIQEEADRLRGILDDFLRYAGRYEITLTQTDLRRVVDELSDFFTPQAESANVTLRTDLPDAPVICRVDAKLLKQALLNLMINAVQAMSDGGELILRLTAHRQQADLEVIDTGSGIPDDVRDAIFDVYYSTKPRGTGLGLPTTRRIVQEHGGTLTLDSAAGTGTRFNIHLPLDDS
ncbi:MAG: two-component sensor histidine kinase [Phycisphaerae bacterium]|nr:two-component sensor histidine kinase [Phycisphaerae bacterium]